MTLIYLLLGIMLTLGGCYCCTVACVNCTDSTDSASVQIDISGFAANLDEAGCCPTLNKSYILTIDPFNFCHFSILFENGQCATTECTSCNDTGCDGSCDQDPTRPCDPNLGLNDYGCVSSATVTYDPACEQCAITEDAAINQQPGNANSYCLPCSCLISEFVWGVDPYLLGNYPDIDWAIDGDPVYLCDCNYPDCTATLPKSRVRLDALFNVDGLGKTTLTIEGQVIGRTIGPRIITLGDSPITCASDINAFPLTMGIPGSGAGIIVSNTCGSGCLCDPPTNMAITYIP